jgi:uncharacterized protein
MVLVVWRRFHFISQMASTLTFSTASLHPSEVHTTTSSHLDTAPIKRKTSKKEISLEALTHRSENLTFDDAKIVANQLEITPLNLIEVGARNTVNGDPLTLVLYPLMHADAPKGRYCNGTRQPFPTIFWMSCPDLRAKISRLEHFGLGNMIQDILDCNSITNYQLPPNSAPILQEFYGYLREYHDSQPLSESRDETYLDQMRRAHGHYAVERWNSISAEDLEHIRSSGWENALNTRVGIAGMKKFTQVKCLHTHYAHHITRPAHGNLIGEWVHEVLVRENSIPRDYCSCENRSELLTALQGREEARSSEQSRSDRGEPAEGDS